MTGPLHSAVIDAGAGGGTDENFYADSIGFTYTGNDVSLTNKDIKDDDLVFVPLGYGGVGAIKGKDWIWMTKKGPRMTMQPGAYHVWDILQFFNDIINTALQVINGKSTIWFAIPLATLLNNLIIITDDPDLSFALVSEGPDLISFINSAARAVQNSGILTDIVIPRVPFITDVFEFLDVEVWYDQRLQRPVTLMGLLLTGAIIKVAVEMFKVILPMIPTPTLLQLLTFAFYGTTNMFSAYKQAKRHSAVMDEFSSIKSMIDGLDGTAPNYSELKKWMLDNIVSQKMHYI